MAVARFRRHLVEAGPAQAVALHNVKLLKQMDGIIERNLAHMEVLVFKGIAQFGQRKKRVEAEHRVKNGKAFRFASGIPRVSPLQASFSRRSFRYFAKIRANVHIFFHLSPCRQKKSVRTGKNFFFCSLLFNFV